MRARHGELPLSLTLNYYLIACKGRFLRQVFGDPLNTQASRGLTEVLSS